MKVLLDETDLRRFADAVVTAQREIAVEMAAPDAPQSWERAPWVYKWGRVVERALGEAFE